MPLMSTVPRMWINVGGLAEASFMRAWPTDITSPRKCHSTAPDPSRHVVASGGTWWPLVASKWGAYVCGSGRETTKVQLLLVCAV